ncbi:MAG: endonuclease [Marmoricola sp.]|nr:endonuclease [Marmoricola sp.]
MIDRARAARRAEQAAAFEQLELAHTWALLHPCPASQAPAHWGEPNLHDETVTPLAGPGAPWVAEFAPADLGAALGISLDAAKALVGDSLELTYRLPRLRDLAATGRVPVWRARLVAQHTRDLSEEAAAFADRLIAATPDKLNQVDISRLVQEARLYFDPDRAIADEEEALAKRGVWLRHSAGPATTEVIMSLDTRDALLFDATVGRLAGDLCELGDTDTLDVRRARAVGILADPQCALDLLSGREAQPSARTGATNLYVHLTPADLEAPVGVAGIEKLGAATTELLTDWLTRFAAVGAKVNLRPVLALDSQGAVDKHTPPDSMRETVILRDAHCVFPGCHRDSRSCDLDHISEYLPMEDGGPPGQTRPGNLAPLCRTHHRVKTHSPWDYKRLDDASYVWTSPTGHQYSVTPASRRPRRT